MRSIFIASWTGTAFSSVDGLTRFAVINGGVASRYAVNGFKRRYQNIFDPFTLCLSETFGWWSKVFYVHVGGAYGNRFIVFRFVICQNCPSTTSSALVISRIR